MSTAASPIMGNHEPRLLLIDAYDSFSNNITYTLRSQLKATITTIRIDDSRFLHETDDEAFRSFLLSFDGVVVGPGPGDPRRPEDIGVISKLWHLPEHVQVPVLGICLGFQALVLAFGGNVSRLNHPRHGVVKPLSHSGTSLFQDVPEVHATQYHSWQAQLGHNTSEESLGALWQSTAEIPSLIPLAWDLSDGPNGPVLMAVQHTEKPFWGVQYHPESICTNPAGAQIIANWWRQARTWSKERNSRACAVLETSPAGTPAHLDSGYVTAAGSRSPSPFPGLPDTTTQSESSSLARRVHWTSVSFAAGIDLVPGLVSAIAEFNGSSPYVLESGSKNGKPVRSETGRYSILGLAGSSETTYEYWTDSQELIATSCGQVTAYQCNASDYLDLLRNDVYRRGATDGPQNVPFWGGFIGFVSYEAGLETISVQAHDSVALGPDICFISVEKSLVIDHVDHKVYIQTLSDVDHEFLSHMKDIVEQTTARASKDGFHSQPAESGWNSTIHRPAQAPYCQKVMDCQSYIGAGDSYELCLTDRSSITFDGDLQPSPLQLFQHLRLTNPAPFAAFLDFGPACSIISSSPERFLSWSRDGECEFRPIKGTVQKRPDVTRADAEAILKTDKEQAENLMIVDLIRHDLNGVVGLTGGQAEVPKLMQVEEYETVYQLVSVIRGQLNSSGVREQTRPQHGIDVLKASLPPGSMTGAPKKRSCELLGKIEGRRRGLYSGVLGYLDVGGGGDFSVVIRSIIKDRQGYSISAGGAVTSLSDPLAEWEEMMGKSTAVKI